MAGCRPAVCPRRRCQPAAEPRPVGRNAYAPAAPYAPASGYAPGPLVVEQYVLTNPALNYAQYLLRAILPTVLHIVVAIAADYMRRTAPV